MIDKFEVGKKYRNIEDNYQYECVYAGVHVVVIKDITSAVEYTTNQTIFNQFEEFKTPEIIHERIYLYYDKNPLNDSSYIASGNSYINYDDSRHWGNLGYIKIEYDKANSNIIDIELVRTKLKE